MDEETINVSFTWTAEELRGAIMQWYATGTMRIISLVLVPLFVALIGVFVAIVITTNEGLLSLAMDVVLLVCAGFLLYVLSPTYQLSRLLPYRKNLFGKQVEWRISGDGFRFELSDGTGGNFSWNSVSKAIKTAKGFLVFDTPWLFHWFPLNAFGSQTEIQKMSDWCRTKARPFKEVNKRIFPGILMGFIVAPLVGACAMVLFSAWSLPWQSHPTALFQMLAVYSFQAYPIALMIGIPTYLILRKYRYSGVPQLMAAGAFTGGAGMLAVLLLLFARAGGLRVDVLTLLQDFLIRITYAAMAGLVAGLAFWLVAIMMNPHYD